MPGIARGRNIAAWRRCIETLADFPWQPEIAGVALAIAARQIDADSIPPDMIDRISNSNVAASAADRNYQFDLELEVGCEWRIGYLCAIKHDGIPRLLEEKRWITLVGFLHFANVVEIVAAHAEDPANRKEASAYDRHLDRWNCGQNSMADSAHAFAPDLDIWPLYQSRICSPFQCTT